MLTRDSTGLAEITPVRQAHDANAGSIQYLTRPRAQLATHLFGGSLCTTPLSSVPAVPVRRWLCCLRDREPACFWWTARNSRAMSHKGISFIGGGLGACAIGVC